MPMFRKHPKFEGIYITGAKNLQRIHTINLDRNRRVYGERLYDEGDDQYREWNPFRSKLAASIQNKARKTFLTRVSKVLYLGASSGTTVSHVSDIVTKGIVYAVEFSPRSLRELVQNCVDRQNVIPILGDANRPFEYSKFISSKVDVLYMDVAQPNQTEILIKNAEWFLTPREGRIIYAIKARSIDTSAAPRQIFQKQIEILEAAGFEITDQIDIAPFSEDHLVLFGRYNPPQ